MNIRYRIFFLFLMTAAFVSAQDIVHIMQRGETIYSIARSYGVEVQEILSLNGITDPTRVQVGQRISIPGASSAGAASSTTGAGGFIEYQVARGESFYGIARSFGTTVDAIRRANNLSESYVLKAGDRLKIPQGAAPGTFLAAGNSAAAATAPTAVTAPAAGNAGAARPETPPRSTVAGTVDASVRWPVNAREVMYMTGKLYGVVLLGERSESVKSLTQGTVVSAGPYRGFGKVAIVQMTGGYLYVYGGCESLSVNVGDRVTPGTELGRLGIDGVSAKPQLFFMVYRSNSPIDPAKAPRA
jgi:murein DD-endopeptidase MepM/ murein hydrolase activator NlpD